MIAVIPTLLICGIVAILEIKIYTAMKNYLKAIPGALGMIAFFFALVWGFWLLNEMMH